MLTTITVTSLADNTDADGEVTLREAIQAANADSSVDGSAAGDGADRIEFAPDLAGGTVTLEHGTLEVTESLVIKGPTERITIDGSNDTQILNLTSDAEQVVLTRMRFVNAVDTAVRHEADLLKVVRSQFENNRGTAIESSRHDELFIKGALFSKNEGGALLLDGPAEITNANFESNGDGTGRGGAIEASTFTTISGATFSENRAESGGAIYFTAFDGGLVLRDSVLTGNVAERGGAIYASDGNYFATSIESSTFEKNVTRDGASVETYGFYCGHDFDETHSTMTGSIVRNNQGGGVYSRGCYSSFTLADSTITGNTTFGVKAEDLFRVFGSTISDNSGLGVDAAYSLTVENSVISGNEAGAVSAESVRISNTTITRNKGLAIYGSGTLDHVTLVDNEVTGMSTVAFRSTITNSIIADNFDADGVQLSVDPGSTVSNSLIASNSGTNFAEARPGSPDADGNLIGTDADPIDPLLGHVFDNGGQTQTMALSHNSPGIDGGAVGRHTADQIGRPRGNAPDMGAFEFDAALHQPPAFVVLSGAGEEGSEVLNFDVRATSVPAPGQTVVVTFDANAITAREGIDFPEFSGTVTLTAASSTQFPVPVPLAADDAFGEPDRTLELFVSDISGQNRGSSDAAVGTILNDDVFKVRAVATPTAEGDSGTTNLRVKLEIIEGQFEPFTVSAVTIDRSAKVSDGDYTAIDTTVAFSGGEGETQSLSVPINGDAIIERAEFFDVDLSWPFDTVSAFITNDDVGAVVQGSTLFVAGGTENDEISVSQNGNQTLVTINGDESSFGSSTIAEILVEAGPGHDVVAVSASIRATIDGGTGHDALSVSGDTNNNVLNGNTGRDTIVGGDGDDTLVGGDGADSIDGGNGNDRLLGQNGADFVSGNNGDDLIWGHSGSDTLLGGADDDSIVGAGSADSISGGTGKDTIAGGGGRDVIAAGAGSDLVRAGSGDDTITGGSGADSLFGEGGKDNIEGGVGDDTLHGAAGIDTLLGQDGADKIYGEHYDSFGYNFIDGGDGSDEIYYSTFAIGGDGNDRIIGTDGDDEFFGGAGDDFLTGGDGHDQLFGGDDADEIYGGAGNDIVFGNNGRDFLAGDEGVDNVKGGKSHDVLVGGPGADIQSGGSGNDLVAAGSNDRFGNFRIIEAWQGDGTYAQRVAAVLALFASSEYELEQDDNAADELIVEAGRDFYLATPGLDVFELAGNEELFELL